MQYGIGCHSLVYGLVCLLLFMLSVCGFWLPVTRKHCYPKDFMLAHVQMQAKSKQQKLALKKPLLSKRHGPSPESRWAASRPSGCRRAAATRAPAKRLGKKPVATAGLFLWLGPGWLSVSGGWKATLRQGSNDQYNRQLTQKVLTHFRHTPKQKKMGQ